MNEDTKPERSTDQGVGVHADVSRDREVWRAALTLAHNICVQESDSYNDDDDTTEAAATLECARRIRGWLSPDETQLADLLAEAGV